MAAKILKIWRIFKKIRHILAAIFVYNLYKELLMFGKLCSLTDAIDVGCHLQTSCML